MAQLKTLKDYIPITGINNPAKYLIVNTWKIKKYLNVKPVKMD